MWRSVLASVPLTLQPLGPHAYYNSFNRIQCIDYNAKGAGASLNQMEMEMMCKAGAENLIRLDLSGSFQLTSWSPLRKLNKLRQLALESCPVTEQDLKDFLPFMKELKYLSLRDCAYLRSDTLQLFESMPFVKCLVHLDMSGCGLSLHLNPNACKAFSSFQELKILHLGGNNISDVVLEFINELNLHYLDISNSDALTDSGLEILSEGQIRATLSCLDIQACKNLTPSIFLTLLRFLKLQNLSLPSQVMHLAAVDGQAANLWQLEQVKKLRIVGGPIHYSWLKILSATCGSHLESLDLSLPSLGHVGAVGRRQFLRLPAMQLQYLLDAAQSFSHLQHLNLSNSAMNLESAIAFMEASPGLETLNLSGCALDPSGLPSLRARRALWTSSMGHTYEFGNNNFRSNQSDPQISATLPLVNQWKNEDPGQTKVSSFSNALGRLQHLHELTLTSSGVSDMHLVHIGKLKKLGIIDLSKNKCITDEALRLMRPNARSYVDINFSGTGIKDLSLLVSDEDGVSCSNEEKVWSLQRLDLSYCNEFNALSLIKFLKCAALQCKHKILLSRLNLSDCIEVENRLIEAIASITSHIKDLSLAGCRKLTEDCFQPISQLRKLRSLNISRCENMVTDNGLLHLCRSIPHLTNLSLAGASRLTQEGLKAALNELPCLTDLDLTCVQNLGPDENLHGIVPLQIPATIELPCGGKMSQRGSPLKRHRQTASLPIRASLPDLVL